MKKGKQLLSLFLVLIVTFLSISFPNHAMEQMPDTNDHVNTVRWMNEMFQKAGVGLAEESVQPADASKESGERIYAKIVKTNIGMIDIVDYTKPAPDGTPWTVLQTWKEGMFATEDGRILYCADPTIDFKTGTKTGVDATKYYRKETVQLIVALHYYLDHHMCQSINENYKYLLKQCAVWWILNMLNKWYPGAEIETGNNVQCGCGAWMVEHKSQYITQGVQWAYDNYMFFADAKGTIYEGNGQPVCEWTGTYQPQGSARLKKVSSQPEITQNHNGYSLEGAQFSVFEYTNGVQGKQVGTFVTDADGNSNTLTLDVGTYVVVETKAPPGFVNLKERKEITIESGMTKEITFSDLPQYASVAALLQKIDADTGRPVPQGTGSFRGARFQVNYFAGLWKQGVNPMTLGKMPDRSWVFITDANGLCKYHPDYFGEGDALFTNAKGEFALPLGTITIQEISSPDGYHINPTVFVKQLVSEGEQETISFGNPVTVLEKTIQLTLQKKQENTTIPIPNARFEHQKPNGEREEIETDAHGVFVLKGLQPGMHCIREIYVGDGYELNLNEIRFEVKHDARIHYYSVPDDSYGKVQFEITTEGNIEIQMEDRLTPFELLIKKKNQEQSPLSGAEFTLYEDAECQREIWSGRTDVAGMLSMSGLKADQLYYLKETKAPEGYRENTDANGKAKVYELLVEHIPAQDLFRVRVDGIWYDKASLENDKVSVAGSPWNRQVVITVINKQLTKLPETGSAWTICLLAIGSGLVLLGMTKRKGVVKK